MQDRKIDWQHDCNEDCGCPERADMRLRAARMNRRLGRATAVDVIKAAAGVGRAMRAR